GVALGFPLIRAGGALGQLPVILEQVLKEVVAPRRRRRGPGDLETAGDGVITLAGSERALPTEPLLLDGGPLRLRAHVGRFAGAVRLAKAVTARDQRDGLLVVHRHAAEGLADVPGGGDRIRLAVRSLGIDVDQAHLHGAKRALEITIAAVALV